MKLKLLRKTRRPTSRDARLNSVQLFLKKAPKLGVSEVWLIGSMANGTDHALSDVDLLIRGTFDIPKIYILRDSIYKRTSVIIMIYTGKLENKSRMRIW